MHAEEMSLHEIIAMDKMIHHLVPFDGAGLTPERLLWLLAVAREYRLANPQQPVG